jgi:hypothetical protein
MTVQDIVKEQADRAFMAEARARQACQKLVVAIGSVGSENVEDAAERAAIRIGVLEMALDLQMVALRSTSELTRPWRRQQAEIIAEILGARPSVSGAPAPCIETSGNEVGPAISFGRDQPNAASDTNTTPARGPEEAGFTCRLCDAFNSGNETLVCNGCAFDNAVLDSEPLVVPPTSEAPLAHSLTCACGAKSPATSEDDDVTDAAVDAGWTVKGHNEDINDSCPRCCAITECIQACEEQAEWERKPNPEFYGPEAGAVLRARNRIAKLLGHEAHQNDVGVPCRKCGVRYFGARCESAQCSTTSEEIFRAIAKGVLASGIDPGAIAQLVGCSTTTVKMWATGPACPHPSMRRSAIKAMLSLMPDDEPRPNDAKPTFTTFYPSLEWQGETVYLKDSDSLDALRRLLEKVTPRPDNALPEREQLLKLLVSRVGGVAEMTTHDLKRADRLQLRWNNNGHTFKVSTVDDT